MVPVSTLVEPRSSIDDIIDLYKRDVDFTLNLENLKLTPEQRILKMMDFVEFLEGLRAAGRDLRAKS